MEINEILAMFFGFCLFAIAVKFWYDARKLEDENEELRKKTTLQQIKIKTLSDSLSSAHEKYMLLSHMRKEDEQP